MLNKPKIDCEKKIITLKKVSEFFPALKNLRGKESKEVSIDQALQLLNNYELGMPIGEIVIRKSVNKSNYVPELEVVEGFSRLKALYDILRNEDIHYDLYHEEFCKVSDYKFYHMPIKTIFNDSLYEDFIEELKTKCAPDFFETYSKRAHILVDRLLLDRVISYYEVECEFIDALKMYNNSSIKY